MSSEQLALIERIGRKKFDIGQIISFAILFIAGLVAVNIYKGENKKITQIRQTQQQEKARIAGMLRVMNLKKKIELYRQTFKSKDSQEIINTITNHAAQSAVKLVSLRPIESGSRGMVTENEIYNKFFFKLIIEVDNYHQLGRFIGKLENSSENSSMFFTIESLYLKLGLSKALEPEPHRIQVDLVISEVFFK